METKSISAAWLTWYASHAAGLAFQLTPTDVTDHGITLAIPAAHPSLEVQLADDGVTVGVTWQGRTWDLLMAEDARPERVAAGWRCGICSDEGRQETFMTLAALRADHFFEPVATWLETRLKPAAGLVICRLDSGSTWAELIGHHWAAPEGVQVTLLPLNFSPQVGGADRTGCPRS